MSSKPEQQQNEPTMEEILASIRRIISEDEPQDGKPAEDLPPATPPAAEQPPQPEAAAGRGADNILDLTKMVAEDGSIVDLAAAGQEEEAADDVVPEMAEAPADEGDEDVAEPAPEEESVAEPEQAAAEAEPQEESVRESPQEQVEQAAEEPSAEELLTPAADAPTEAESDEDAADEEEDAPSAAVPATAGGFGDEGEYVSAATARAATASLAAVTKAAMANRQGDAVAIGGGRTLEELVRESLAPELKGWLDENLPELVERIVREEIRKMVRRAEDQ